MNIVRNTLVMVALIALVAPPMVSAHPTSAVASRVDSFPPGFTQTPVGLLGGASSSSPDESMSGAMGSGYDIKFTCPAAVPKNVGPAPPVGADLRCPRDQIDAEDIMSQPILLVDPKDSTLMAFNALHGSHGLDSAPFNNSRDNLLHQPHTTFYWRSGEYEQGIPANDNPYYSPLNPPPNKQDIESPLTFAGVQLDGKQVYGTDNAAVLDGQGRVYLASLYAVKENKAAVNWSYAFGLWKSQYTVKVPVDYYSGNTVKKLPAAAQADNPTAVYVPGADRVALLWREVDGGKSYINFTWTIPGKGGQWTNVQPNQRINGCSAITNAIAVAGYVYIGCYAEKGYQTANATLGNLQIHKIDARNDRWKPERVDEATVSRTAGGFNTILVDRLYGNMAVVQAGLTNDKKPFLKVAKGVLGGAWDDPMDYTSHVRDDLKGLRPQGITIDSARVNAAAYVARSGSILLIYKEHYKYADAAKSGITLYKAIMSVGGAHGEWNGYRSLVPTVPQDQSAVTGISAQDSAPQCQLFDARTQGQGQDVFDDNRDSIVTWIKPKVKEQKHFIAYGDCGNVRVAEIHEEEAGVLGVPFPPQTPPIPLATAGQNAAQVGAAMGVVAGSMVIRMLAFKRKVAVEAPA